ncbi:MAG TPA: PQQ-binding-like beta-propeller repeat protein [Ktedonobacterales bacterium]|nr:PQQ-binding-like beta-propeller repeat protein [Ktedonobacterales bacterium]
MAGKKVFICAAAEDTGYTNEIITVLNAWEVRYSELGAVPGPVTGIPPAIQSAISECEVFLRICTANTKQSSAVNFTTGYFQQLLQQDRAKKRQQRRLVNLILDPAYPLDDEDKKTLYIMAPGKTRARWLDELAVPVGVATLAQRISRRAVLGMGAGAVLTLASAGVSGTLLVQERQQRQQDLALPVRAKISGNPRYSFRLSDSKTPAFARVFQDGATIYAQPDFASNLDNSQTDSSVYVLSAGDRKQRRISIAAQPAVPGHDPIQSVLIAAASGTLFLYSNPGGVFAPLQIDVLSAVSARDGKELWKVTTALAGTPAVSDGVAYCVLQDVTKSTHETIFYDVSLNALSMRDGSRLWRITDYKFDPILTPAVANGRLYIGSYDHNVYCFDPKTGKKLWSYLTRGPVLGTPTIANGTVYIGSRDGNLYALDAETGAFRWRFASSVGFLAAPLVLDGVVYAPSQDVYVYALDARSGAMFWRSYVGADPNNDDLPIRSVDRNPVAVYRNVLFAAVYGGLYAFDIRTGAQRWRYIPVEEETGTMSQPVISDGFALVGAADNQVYVVNP